MVNEDTWRGPADIWRLRMKTEGQYQGCNVYNKYMQHIINFKIKQLLTF